MEWNRTYVSDPYDRYKGGEYKGGSQEMAVYCETEGMNPFVEALPPFYVEKEDLRRIYHIDGTLDYEEIAPLPKYIQLDRLSVLSRIRFSPGYEGDLEFYFYKALVTSYSRRNWELRTEHVVPVQKIGKKTINFSQEDTAVNMRGATAEASGTGIALIGLSGTGKTSAVKRLLSHYPQVLIHDLSDVEGTPYMSLSQVLYLYVICDPNSDFASLFGNIGGALDEALHTGNSYFRCLYNSFGTIAQKEQQLIQHINDFSIGAIIIDEAENLSMSRIQTQTFRRFLAVQDQTQCAFFIIGTEDAYERIFSTLMMKRRYTRINSTVHAKDPRRMATIIKWLFRNIRPFPDQLQFQTDDELGIIDVFADYTGGIIGLMIDLYENICRRYIMCSDPKPTINRDFILGVARYYFGDQKEAIKYSTADPMFDAMYKELFDPKILRLSKSGADSRSDVEILEDTISAVSLCSGSRFTRAQIEEAYYDLTSGASEDLVKLELIVPAVYEKLSEESEEKTKKTKNNKKKKPVRCEINLDAALDNSNQAIFHDE